MFKELLDHPDVEEVLTLRGHDIPPDQRIGFMAYHGGGLEEMTEVIAMQAAERSGTSYYGVHQPKGMERHIPSIEVSPESSTRLTSFIQHVHTVITIHGFGRQGYYSSLLLGGQHRIFAQHVGSHLRTHLPAYKVITDIDEIPKELRGLHPRNPVNLPPGAGVHRQQGEREKRGHTKSQRKCQRVAQQQSQLGKAHLHQGEVRDLQRLQSV